jgi:hypothetical protein
MDGRDGNAHRARWQATGSLRRPDVDFIHPGVQHRLPEAGFLR